MNEEKIFTDTLEKIRVAINERNFENFSAHVDTEKFLNGGYGEVVAELAKNCAEFKKLYPHDLLFKFGSTALKIYMTKFKGVHLGFVQKVVTAYFDKNLTQPKNFLSAPIDFSACELRKFLSALTSEIKNISVDENKALAEIEIFGDNSNYGKIFGRLNFKFEFAKNSAGTWELLSVKNIPELVPPILHMCEIFWPSAWDLGIKL